MTNSLSASAPGSEMPANGSHPTRTRAGLWGLAVGSIGVVYGDIGTSPLYAMRVALEAASGPDHGGITRATVIGVVALLGIASAGLFYGDAVITPALSVLSAVEGIDVATPAFHEYVVPFTVVILIALFAGQSRGTAKVAALFGPIMTVWFVVIAIPGVLWVAADPGVLWALNPLYGIDFLLHHGLIGLYTLGAVFLAVTGAEALYADLGHFGP